MRIEAIWLPQVQQQVFRSLMEAMSRPGKVENLAEVIEQSSPARAVLATVLDAEVSLCDHHDLLESNDWPLLQAENKRVEQADYILCLGNQAPDFEPKMGTLSSPEHSATLILHVDSVSEGDCQLKLSGPGVDGQKAVAIQGLHQDWLSQREQWNAAFPLGVDFIVVDQQKMFALARTTKVEVI